MILNQSLLLDQKAIVGPTFEINHDFESKFTFGSKGTILDQKSSLVKKTLQYFSIQNLFGYND